jgi:hypothetical protein
MDNGNIFWTQAEPTTHALAKFFYLSKIGRIVVFHGKMIHVVFKKVKIIIGLNASYYM